MREISPTSTNPFPRSHSVLSGSSAQSVSLPFFDAIPEDDTTAQEGVSDGQLNFQDTSSHLFLKWADHRQLSIPLASQTKVRHSDIVIFSFRILEIPENEESFRDLINSLRYDHENSRVMLHALRVIRQNKYTLPLERGQILDLEKYWTGVNTQTSYGRSTTGLLDQRIRASLLFRTFCQEEDWQLKREVYCVIWSSRAASLLSQFLEIPTNFFFDEDCLPSIQSSEFHRVFQQLHKLSGRQSVAYALDNTSLILLPREGASGRGNQLQWRQPQSQDIPEHIIAKSVALFDSASRSENIVHSCHHQCDRLLWVIRTEEAANIIPGLIKIPDHVGKGGAMLVLKPAAWPQQCPRFCLFVLLSHDFQDQASIGRLLRYTVQMQDMYCVYEDTGKEPEPLSAADKYLLKSWEDSFSRQTTLRG